MLMNLDALTTFLGWMTVINIGLLTVSTLIFMLFQNQIISMHHSLIDIEPNTLKQTYLSLLGFYKILIITFNLVPYLVLKFLLA
jgi:hypothetical protein